MDYGLVAVLLLLTGVLWSPMAAAEVRAGVAREAFVLPERIPLAGYSRRKGTPSRGVHDPVGVRAVVLQDAQTTAVLASCDLLIIDESLCEAVRRRLLAQGWPQRLVLILAATHTHSGPGAYGTKFLEKMSMGHFNPKVLDVLVEGITRTIVKAHEDLSPVRLAYRTTLTDGLVMNRMDERGFADTELIVCAFYREGQTAPFVVLVNFAAHPTTLGAWNRQLSADYPGVVVREVERRVPTATCLFFAGAVGDQGPVKAGSGFERSERVGLPLAQLTLTLLEQASAEPANSLRAIQEVVPLSPARVRLASWLTLPRILGGWMVDDDATLSLLAVGRVAFLGVPCDLTAGLGQELKAAARARGFSPMLIGFACDYIGYCVPEPLYRTRAYETSMAFNGPQTGELIVNRLTQLLDQIVTSSAKGGSTLGGDK